MYYGPLIAEKAGIEIDGLSKDDSALLMNIPLSLANFVGCIACVFFIESSGRRTILLRTLPCMALCWFIAAIGMSFTGESQTLLTQKAFGLVAIVSICCFLIFF